MRRAAPFGATVIYTPAIPKAELYYMARQLVFENESEMIAWIMEREYLMETLYDMIESEFYGDE